MTPDQEQRIVAARFEPAPDYSEWVYVTCSDGSEHMLTLIPSDVEGVEPELCLGKTCGEADGLLWSLTADAMREHMESERRAERDYLRSWADVLGGRAPGE